MTWPELVLWVLGLWLVVSLVAAVGWWWWVTQGRRRP
jgi:uncharacterized membrane protein YqiK